jgi:dienelactone hydrolase
MSHRVRAVAFILASGLISAFALADQSTVIKLLRKDILAPDTTRGEVETYLKNHIAPMPAVKNVKDWEAYAAKLRRDLLDQVFLKGVAARWRDTAGRVEWLDTIPGGPGYSIRKLRFEALPGFWIPALLYVPDKLSGKVPVVLNVNGHTQLGNAYVPKQIRCINLAKKGMIAMNLGWIGWGQLGEIGYDHYRLNQIDLCGTSGLAPFYLEMKRALDILISLPNADPKRVAMAGLSGGGWQTVVFSALDPRVTLADPVAGFSDYKTRAIYNDDLGDSEQAPMDMAQIADYTHLVALRAPRPTLLTFNAKDGIFTADRTLPPLLAAAEPIFKLYGKPGNLRTHVNEDPGTHNFLKDNRQAFYKMLGDFFYQGDKRFSAVEIDSDAEVKSVQELLVPLPVPNGDLHTLALDLAKNLPRDPVIPSDEPALAAWKQDRLSAFREIVRAKDYTVTAEPAGKETTSQGEEATYWRLKAGSDPTERWTVPAVEITAGEQKNTVILIADSGKGSTPAEFDMLLAYGSRVIAMDPFDFGECLVHSRFAIHVSASGGRPLGVDASQVAAVARWLAKDRGFGPVKIVSVGPRASLIALTAAALEEKAISGVDCHDPMRSLKEALTRNLTIEDTPELFNFGLLERFDIPQIEALIAPRPVIEQ